MPGCGHRPVETKRDAQASSSAEPAFDEGAFVEELDARLRAAQVEYGIPVVALAVVAHGKVVYAKTLEIDEDPASTRERDRPYLFPLSSTTKTLTSTAVALVVADGVVSWKSRLASLMPAFESTETESDWPSPSLAELMSHRSGFFRMGPVWGDGQRTLDEVIETVSHAAPLRPPGEAFEYNNVMFSVGVVGAARAGNMSWSEMLAERVLDPLGMDHTFAPGHATIEGVTTLPGYVRNPQVGRSCRRPRSIVETSARPEASTRLCPTWRSGRCSSRGEASSRGSSRSPPSCSNRCGIRGCGLGPAMPTGSGGSSSRGTGDGRMVTHGGNSDYGYSSSFAVLPDDGVGFVFLCNVNHSPLQAEIVDLVFDGLEPDLSPSPGYTVPLPQPEAAEPKTTTPERPPIEIMEPTGAMTEARLVELRAPKPRKRALLGLGKVPRRRLRPRQPWVRI